MSAEALGEIAEYIKERLGAVVEKAELAYDELTVTVNAARIIDALVLLRDDVQCQFIALIDISGADYPDKEKRFAVCYHLLSPRQNLRLRLKLHIDENTPVPSACAVFAGAEWYEREIYDMYGVYFSDHPDMRRILTDYGFQGYPLRKDFPVSGFVECRYDNEVKGIVYEPVLLRQEMRSFDFLSPWEAADYILPGDEKAKKG
ncbi:MAG: NADH-quinone oxidoreductase subunit C [Candidatus Tokpelaia sp.]|uniref:NADH-quinone oxidoreductase subunit C n=1 Tax=Candidatus Tokpelaia sp. TaxID=2233777 RepID=UPI00123ABD03|nr:NADH-quinone oxidoreductase subunit C [Candidatus Tokpelaia sp.]KAA6205557.1 MAG: NADH-quinone oxidoreductase subunit C [Candidatus Tokpelaia sp.]KAA6207508.1 MAG: NADH-quinone oxidoreductase subunit C [Candidatus Tokpelaia sp.]KAA6404678.1 NADH-quinone oxidoreductase subunit C [Candidatus Tokpelaia sp.]